MPIPLGCIDGPLAGTMELKCQCSAVSAATSYRKMNKSKITMNSSSKPQRDPTIDIAKGIGIILVVIGHNAFVVHSRTTVFEFIFSFHMPLFFVLSGMYINRHLSFKEFVTPKFDSLIKPYFTFFLLFWIVLAAAGNLDTLGYVEGIVYASTSTIVPIAIPAWFLPNLFISLCLAYLLIKLAGHSVHGDRYLFFIASGLLVIGIVNVRLFWNCVDLNWVIPSYQTGKTILVKGLPWNMDLLPVNSALIIFGWLCRDKIRNIRFQWLPFIVALVLFGLLHKYFHYYVDLAARKFDDVAICISQIVLGIYLVLAISSKLREFAVLSGALAYIGQISLIILLFHMPIRNAFARVLAGSNLSFLATSIIASLVCFFGSIAIFEFAVRVKPFSMLLLPKNCARLKNLSADTGKSFAEVFRLRRNSN